MSAPTPLAASQPPTYARFGVLAFLCSLSLLTYLDRVCIMRAKEAIQGDLGLTEIEMGFVFSIFLLGYAIFEVPGGWMGDRWGSRRVITGIVLWWSAFTAMSGFVPRWDDAGFSIRMPQWDSAGGVFTQVSVFLTGGLMVMLLVRFLFGLGEAGAYPNIARVVGAWFPFGERAFAQGSVWMSARLGGAVAPAIFGVLMTQLGWREAFWILGGVGALWAVLFCIWFRSTPEEQPNCNDAERELIRAGPYSMKSSEAHAGHAFPPWRWLVWNANIWALCVASAGVSFGWYFYPTWQPVFLQQRFGISFKDSQLITGLPFFCGAIGSFIGGSLSDWLIRKTGSRRWGRSGLGLVCFFGAGACVLATGAVTEAWQAVALLCLAFLINDLAIPVIWAASTDIGGRYSGTVAGVMNMAGGLGSVVSPSLTPILREHFHLGWPAIFAVLSGGWFIAALAWLRIDASEKLEPDTLEAGHLPTEKPAGHFAESDERIQAKEDRFRSPPDDFQNS